MKKIIILLSLIVTVFGQPSFTAHSISTSADLANYVHAADVDGDGDPVGAGVYLYQLQAKDFVKTRKMVLLK